MTPEEVEDVVGRLEEHQGVGAALSGSGRFVCSLMDEAASLLRTQAERIAELERERDAADHHLVDKYRDPKTGHFKFPGDVAAIVRRLDTAQATMERYREALEPWGVIADAVLSEAPPDATKAKLWNGCDNSPLFVSLEACRRARSVLEGKG